MSGASLQSGWRARYADIRPCPVFPPPGGAFLCIVIPGRAKARTRNLEIPGSVLRTAPE